jgi:hypothetical protein
VSIDAYIHTEFYFTKHHFEMIYSLYAIIRRRRTNNL